MKKTRKNYCIVAMVIIGTALFILLSTQYNKREEFKDLIISEVGGNGYRYVYKGNVLCNDYVEIFNPTDMVISLEDYSISDRYSLKKSISLKGEGTSYIQPHDYIVVILADDAAFNIKEKEVVYLSKSEEIIDKVVYTSTTGNMSVSRSLDGQEIGVAEKTPGQANSEIISLNSPKFSMPEGYYDKPIELEMTVEDGYEIFYTLDGSVPTQKSLIYNGTIVLYNRSEEKNNYTAKRNVVKNWQKEYDSIWETEKRDKGTVVRAVCYDMFGHKSEIVSGTYFIEVEHDNNTNTIALVVDPEEMWGENGIYITGDTYDAWLMNTGVDQSNSVEEPQPNFRLRGREWEINAQMSSWMKDEYTKESIGIRIQGASARDSRFKRLSLYARDIYGGKDCFSRDYFEKGFLPHSMVLREGFSDAFTQFISKDRDVATAAAIPVTVFVNGEFFYNTYLREKYDSSYIEGEYSIPKKDVIIYRNKEISEGYGEDFEYVNSVYAFINDHNGDLSDVDTFNAFCQLIDLQSYIDSQCINLYINNMDFNESHNNMWWRSRTGGGSGYSDGKWRWGLYDLDAVEWNYVLLEQYHADENAAINTFSEASVTAGLPYNQQMIFKTLRTNELFNERFVVSFMDIANTVFSDNNIRNNITEWGETINWLDSFFLKRSDNIKKYMYEEFNLSGDEVKISISSNIEQYDIRFNTSRLCYGTFNGYYFTDYPINLEAMDIGDKKFLNWCDENGNKYYDRSMRIYPYEGMRYKAIYEK